VPNLDISQGFASIYYAVVFAMLILPVMTEKRTNLMEDHPVLYGRSM
jgi:hypothetical protein